MATKKAKDDLIPDDPAVHHRKGEPDRLKIDGSWEDAARKLLGVKHGPVPARVVKGRKVKGKGKDRV